MCKFKSISFIILLSFFLIACQSNDLTISEDISSVEVYEWDDDVLITTVQDQNFIEQLIKELNKASTHTTADMDYELPDYRLIFKSGEVSIFEIGYYKQVVNLGIKGRYLDVDKDLMYGVKTQLSVN